MNGSAGAIEGCYWQADRETREVSPALSGDIKVNVAVIGGGFTGLAAAYHLKVADPGLEIALAALTIWLRTTLTRCRAWRCSPPH